MNITVILRVIGQFLGLVTTHGPVIKDLFSKKKTAPLDAKVQEAKSMEVNGDKAEVTESSGESEFSSSLKDDIDSI